MKNVLLGALLLISLSVFSQVELVRKSPLVEIGKVQFEDSNGDYNSLTLQSRKKEEKTFYTLVVNSCELGFFANRSELNLIYKTVLDDFSNLENADSELLLGDKTIRTVGINSPALSGFHRNAMMRDYSNRDKLLIHFDRCVVRLQRQQWVELFEGV